LEELARSFSTAGESRLLVSVEAPADLTALPAAVEVAAYRIVQEALTNVARHAHATRALVHITVAAAMLRLTIRDNGCGLPAAHHRGVGLQSIRERAVELGGACAIASDPGSGAMVSVELPLRAAVPARLNPVEPTPFE
jgi:signal transduction histidine kinase